MRACCIALAMLTFGCAARHPTRGESIRAAEISLKGVAVVHEQQSSAYNSQARARLEFCDAQSLPTSSDRRACLGSFSAFSVYASDAREYAEAYDRVIEELATLRDLAARMDAADAESAASETTRGN